MKIKLKIAYIGAYIKKGNLIFDSTKVKEEDYYKYQKQIPEIFDTEVEFDNEITPVNKYLDSLKD